MNVSAQNEVNVTPVFEANYFSYQEGWPIICNEGGSRSGKTYSIIQLLCYLCRINKGLRVSIVSHSLPHIKRGAYRDFKQIMTDYGFWNDNNFRYTDFVYEFSNGSYIELFGLEDEGKARGPGRDILFVNEANLISKVLFDQLAMRTTGTIFMDWNPAEFNSWVYDIADNPKNKKIHSTYLDNIYNLSPVQVEYIESYKDLPDDFMWKVYGLGQRGASKELIYTSWKIVKELPNKGQIFYGLDFGYTAPTALVKVEFHEGSLYVEEMIYQSKLTANDLVNRLKELNLSRSDELFCDSAEPKTIEELVRAGFNAKPSEKDVWGGSVQQIVELSGGATLKVTIARWYTPNDKNIDKQGIEPDKEVKQNDDDQKSGVDTQLQAALASLR
jgi:phage terminase large subunit